MTTSTPKATAKRRREASAPKQPRTHAQIEAMLRRGMDARYERGGNEAVTEWLLTQLVDAEQKIERMAYERLAWKKAPVL